MHRHQRSLNLPFPGGERASGIRRPLAIVIAGLIGTASIAAFAQPAGRPEFNSCHGGDCSWSITRSRTVVRQDARGILYRLTLLGGSAREGSRRIRWNSAPHELFIFCSRLLPATILPDRGHLQVDVLDFVTGPMPDLESSASLYVRTCHPGEDWAADGFAARHGYRTQDTEREITLSRPEDIFNYAH